jgi:DNA-binding response OmpR family regulator
METSANPETPVPFLEPPSKGLILICDDQRGFRKIYRDVLEKDGYGVLEATTGEEAWEAIIEKKPDLVLLDLGLPVLDGFQVLEKIRRSNQTLDIPVIIFSVLGEPRDVQKALQMGANDYTVKGFYTPRQVLSKIRDLLHNRQKKSAGNSYRLHIQVDIKDEPALRQDLGLEDGMNCPDCHFPLDAEYFPDYARADGHWFAARFICPKCEKPF